MCPDIIKRYNMALRNIREFGDPVLRKECKTIDKVTDRIRILADDMLDTMYESQGVGLAAPQVGILKRLVVIDIGEGPVVMINPVITASSGEQTDIEGCLSYPGKGGNVTRPMYVTVEFDDLEMNRQVLETEGLMARAVCHELDHLEGVLYIDKVSGDIVDMKAEEEE
jgi:peptide deformylase